MMYGYGYGDGPSWWMDVIQVVVTAAVIAGIALAVIIVARHVRTTPESTGRKAHAILEERFARGEIDDQEFQRRVGLLSQP